MRSIRTLTALALTLAVAFGVSSLAQACTASAAKVAGTFNENGEFVVSGALDSEGSPISSAEGFVVRTLSMPEDGTITAADYQNKTLYMVGDLDFDNAALAVTSFTDCAKTAGATVASSSSCGTKAAAAQVASAGASCSSKGASAKVAGAGSSCSSKGASAKVASAGSSCSSKGASAKVASAGSSCSSKGASAKVAGAGSSCSSKGASAKVASAGEGCCAGDATAAASTKVASAGEGCCASATAASTKVAGSSCSKGAVATTAGSSCSAKSKAATTAARSDVRYITYNVDGMKCGVSCVAKVQETVKALEMDGVVNCDVKFEDKQAIVTVDKDVDEDAIAKAIAAAGYTVERVEEEAGDETATK